VFLSISFLYINPAKYVDINTELVVFYVLTVTFVFSLGYFFGSSGRIYSPHQCAENFLALVLNNSTQRLINMLLFFGVCGVVFDVTMLFRTGGVLSFSALGENYIDLYSGYIRGASRVNAAYLAKIFFNTTAGLCLFFASFFISKLTRVQKSMFLFVISAYLVTSVLGSGKQKYLGDVVVAGLVYLAFIKARNNLKIRAVKLFSFFLLSGVVFCVFLEILRQRYAAAGIGIDNINEVVHPLMYWDVGSVFFDVVGERYGFSLAIFLGYFTNGLYGLYLSLTLPFEWTYFVGNSYSLTRIVEMVIGDSGVIYDSSYPVRVGDLYGWDASKWHSLYAWMASDFTFYGVVVIAGFFGLIYGHIWLASLNATRVAAGPLFSMLTLGLVFSLANNQLMHSLAGILGLLFLMVLMFVIKPVRQEKKS